MVKKTLLSLAIAATAAGLAGCNVSSTDKYENDIDNTPVLSGQPGFTVDTVTPQFQPTRDASFGGALAPLATDIVFSKAATTDGTADTADTTPPVTTALNKLAGFSTTAPFYVNFTGALDPESVEAGKSVFLIKLKNATDNAAIDALNITTILAAAGGNPSAALAADQPEAGVDYEARYLTLDNGNTHTVQIIPKKPLSSKTKYIVAFSNGIKSASGKPAMASGDTLLIRSDQAVPEALQGLRSLMRVWDGIARTATGLTADSLVLSYSFTTDGSLDALKQYAAPSLFVANKLPLATAESLIEASSAGATTAIAQGVVLTGGGNPSDSDQVAAAKLTDDYASAIYSQIAAATLTGAPASLNALVNRPAPRTVAMVDGATVDTAVNAARGNSLGASPANFATGTSTTARYYQGMIKLPNFLDQVALTTELTPAGISAAMKADADWSANTTVGAVLDAALGNAAGTTPPKDTDGSTNVTYRYPFPQPSSENAGVNEAPLLVTMPSSAACGGATEVPVVIYVHGITGSRANSVAYAAALASSCIATVAIDLPLHGIAPLATDSNGALVDNSTKAFNMEYTKAAFTRSPWGGVIAAQVAGDVDTFAGVAERHGNIYQDGNSIRQAMDFDGTVDTAGTDEDFAAGTSGSAFINLQNFTRSRDNLRQAVVDLLNLNASLAGISDIVDDFPTGTGFDLDKVFVAGHSLGAIVATTFVAVNNDASVLAANTDLNKVQGVILANGGAHISKLLENSPSFGPSIVGGLAASGVEQGTDKFEKFMYVIQSTLDVVDPANSGLKLAETDTPVVLFNMVGGNTLPSDSNALAKVSYPTAFKALGVYLPDHTVPNFDYFADADSNPYAAFASALGLSAEVPTAKAPLAGTDGLAAIMGLETVNANTDTSTLGSPTRVVTRFSEGTHSTFANADTTAAFTEMVVESVTLINGAFSTANPAVLESSN